MFPLQVGGVVVVVVEGGTLFAVEEIRSHLGLEPTHPWIFKQKV